MLQIIMLKEEKNQNLMYFVQKKSKIFKEENKENEIHFKFQQNKNKFSHLNDILNSYQNTIKFLKIFL